MAILLDLKEKIINISKNIDDKIKISTDLNNSLSASLETIKELRNLSDFCLAYEYYRNNPTISASYCYQTFSQLIEPYIKNLPDRTIKDIYELHTIANETTTHDLPSNCGADMVVLRYKDKIHKIITYVKNVIGLDILTNYDLIFKNISKDIEDYYGKISKVIEESNLEEKRRSIIKYKTNHYYLEKVKPFPIKKDYYELTFIPANDEEDKRLRFIVYSDQKIPDYYPVRLLLEKKTIRLVGGVKIDVLILVDYLIVIKGQDINNLSRILHIKRNDNSENYANLDDYKLITAYMKKYHLSLYDMVATFSNDDWNSFIGGATAHPLYDMVIEAKKYIDNRLPGYHTLSLLLHRPRVKCMRKCVLYPALEHLGDKNEHASDLALSYQSLPFEQMPVASSLPDYPVLLRDKIHILNDFYQRKDELFSLFLNIQSSDSGRIYIKKNEVDTPFDLQNEDVDALISSFNGKIYRKHIKIRSIKTFAVDSKYVFIQHMEDNCLNCLRTIIMMEQNVYPDYANKVSNYIRDYISDYDYLSDEQKSVVNSGFLSRGVLCISGPAGTGKTTLLESIRNILKNQSFQFLSQTNASVNNLRRRIGYMKTEGVSTRYSTIESFIRDNNAVLNDVCVVIDESSTVSNKDMADVLTRINVANCPLIICGDDQQIEAIEFGNWFTLSKSFLKEDSVFYLTYPFRTNNKDLQCLWNMVRRQDDKLKTYLPRIGIINDVSIEKISEMFNQNNSVILCLNYDGLYGVNNLNNILQQRNNKTPYEIDDCIYKENDPVIFDSSTRLEKYVYNNQKGLIKSIKKFDGYYEFVITLFDINDIIQKEYFEDNSFEYSLLKISDSTAELTMKIYEYEKIGSKNNKQCALNDVPFSVAYAITIHKAQGLEYENVAVVISDEISERINKNIFYTAITRSKERLNIFCNSVTMNNIIDAIVKQKKNVRDKKLIQLAYPEFVDNNKQEP